MKLIDLLKDEQGILSQLLQILKNENTALVKDDISSLNKIVRAKEALNNSILKIESCRVSDFGNLSISSIVGKLESEGKLQEACEIDSIGTDMKEKIFNIKQLNETNQLLIRQSLNYVRSMIDVLSPKNKLYNPSGEINSNVQQKSTLDISI